MNPLCDCGEEAKHEVAGKHNDWLGRKETIYLCTACYAKHLANESINKLLPPTQEDE